MILFSSRLHEAIVAVEDGMVNKLIWLAVLVIIVGGVFLVWDTLDNEAQDLPEVEVEEVPLEIVEEPKTQLTPNTNAIESIRSSGKSEKVPAQMGPKNQLSGKVTTPDGKPIAGVKITLFRYNYLQPARTGRIKVEHSETERESVATGEGGRYLFPDLSDEPGPYFSMRIEKAGFSEVLKDGVGAGMIVDAQMLPGIVLRGRIIDADTGEAISGVFCDAGLTKPGKTKHEYRRWRRHFKSKSDGTFEVNGVPDGNLSLYFEHGEYQWLFIKPEDDFWATANLSEQLEIRLKRGFELNGIVVDSLTEQPISECSVTMREYIIPTRREITGVFGKFGFKGLNPGRFEMVLSAKGYSDLPMMLEVNAEALKGQKIFKMKPAGYASGVVVDPDGTPIPGAEIYVAKSVDIFRNVRGNAEARSDGQGVFTIDGLNNGKTYRLAVVADGYCIGISADFEAVAGEYVDGIIVQLAIGATVRGLVVDENEVPIKNVVVTLEQPQFRDVWFAPGMKAGQSRTLNVATNDNGYWEFDGLWPGPYQLSMHHIDYVPLAPSKLFVEKYSDRIDQPVSLTRGQTIKGMVLTDDGLPAAGVTVTASLGRFRMNAVSTKTAADGTYILGQLHDKSYRIKANSDQGIAPTKDDVLPGSSDVDFQLLPYGSLEGTVIAYQSGIPIERFKITVKPLHDIPKSQKSEVPLVSRLAQKLMEINESYVQTTMVSPDGKFRIDRLEPGNYVVEIEADDRVPMSHIPVIVQPSSISAVKTFVLREGANIHGVIKDSEGAPINPASITVTVSVAPNTTIESTVGPDGKKAMQQGGSTWKPRGVSVNEKGEYRIGGLPIGQVKLALSSPTYCCPDPVVILCGKEGSAQRNFTLEQGGKVIIQVTDGDGTEIKGIPAAQIFTEKGESARIDGRRIAVQGGSRGRLTIHKIAPGRYTAEIKCFGYRHDRFTFEISARETEIIKAPLEVLR
ncbi:MAG: hypothetical protein ACI97A_002236 [Planctomycetota bacterium]